MEVPYRGLSNIGATCYMNSLLQTLFMTPQFRDGIYKWQYDEKVHPSQSDSILYQLQKLFAKLQKGYPAEINTQDLVKSFQWNHQEVQMQQDIQEFNRVLFEALYKSLNKTNCNTDFLKLFQGQSVHYTKCLNCKFQSTPVETFQDLNLPVKNIYEKVYNDSLELAFQRDMKPEYLDGANLYECQNCNMKVQAERGVKFIKMPKLLNIILQRFTFNYFTFERQKINDRVEFPYILNFNNYIGGYENIPNKLNEDSSAHFFENKPPKKKISYKKVTKAKQPQPSVVGKLKTKPSAQTRSFVTEMRKKKYENMGTQNEDLIYLSGNKMSTNTFLEENISSEKIGSQSYQKIKVNSQNMKIINQEVQGDKNQSKENSKVQIKKQNSENFDQNQKINSKIEQKQLKNVHNGVNNILLPPLLTIQPTQPSIPYKNIKTKQSLENELNMAMIKKDEQNEEKQLKLSEFNQKCSNLIQLYLKNGPLVYELYSIMIQNGGATHGHYYSYIKSFENGRWYNFNDERVTEINVLQLDKAFGGVGTSSAYALYYRMVDEVKQKIPQIPQYIEDSIKNQVQYLKQLQANRMHDLQDLITLKICYQLYVRQLQLNKNTPFHIVTLKSRQLFNIQHIFKEHNVRLRLFNPVSQTKLDTYQTRQMMTLQMLNIGSYKSLLLEVKKEQQVFQTYESGHVSIRIVLWKQTAFGKFLPSLQEQHLKLHKVKVIRNASLQNIRKSISQKRSEVLKIPEEAISIVKRHQNDEFSYHQILSLQQNILKSMEQLSVLENEILFIEPQTDHLNWPIEFENEIYRITIKYTLAAHSDIYDHLTDSRITLSQLKQTICNTLELDSEDIILKRGNKSGIQLKNLSLTLKQHRFITGTQLYLEPGIPAKVGETRIQLFQTLDAPIDCYSRLHQFEFLANVPVNGTYKASEVKQTFIQILKKIKYYYYDHRKIDLNKEQFRIRQKVADKIGKIYRQKPMKEQQLIQKREIAIEFTADSLEMKDYAIYIRIWNQKQWTLSEKYQLIVNKMMTMRQLAEKIYATTEQIQISKMQACRVLSIHKFNILDLLEMEYHQMESELLVVAEPLFVNTDGILYIIKNCQIQPSNLTKEQQQKFGGKIKINTRRNISKSSTTKEKGIIIQVMEKQKQINEKIQQQNSNMDNIQHTIKPEKFDDK